MSTMNCRALREISDELAFDVVSGTERAAALAHLEVCPACQAEVAAIAGIADSLLELAPCIEPPHGFDALVLEEIDALARAPIQPAPASRRALRHAVSAGALAAVLAMIFAVVTLVAPWREPAARTQARISASDGRVVGRATLGHTHPPTVAINMHDWPDVLRSYGATPDAPVFLTIVHRSGAHEVHTLPHQSSQSWREEFTTTSQDGVASIAITGTNGLVWCSATFG